MNVQLNKNKNYENTSNYFICNWAFKLKQLQTRKDPQVLT